MAIVFDDTGGELVEVVATLVAVGFVGSDPVFSFGSVSFGGAGELGGEAGSTKCGHLDLQTT